MLKHMQQIKIEYFNIEIKNKISSILFIKLLIIKNICLFATNANFQLIIKHKFT